MTDIVLFNGPKGSGKDYICESLARFYDANHCMFKLNLYDETRKLFGIDYDEFYRIATDRELKEFPDSRLEHPVTGKFLSPRMAMIYTSENVMKPQYGKGIFGQLACEQVVEGEINVFSDSGFYEEAHELANRFGASSVMLVHIFRDGCSFEGDSRDYLFGTGLKTVDFYNDCDYTPREIGTLIFSIIQKWIDEKNYEALRAGWT